LPARRPLAAIVPVLIPGLCPLGARLKHGS
jgi:hypothetical protein